MKRIHVAAAIIINGQDQILIAKRPDHLHQGGLWEFPGGKVEADEAVTTALVRELQEELDITPTEFAAFSQISHDYEDKSVLLDFWQVTGFIGTPIGKEQQAIRWVPRAALADFAFPAANQPVVDDLIRSV